MCINIDTYKNDDFREVIEVCFIHLLLQFAYLLSAIILVIEPVAVKRYLLPEGTLFFNPLNN